MTENKKLKILKSSFILSIIFFICTVGLKFYLCNVFTVKNEEFEKISVQLKELKEEVEVLNVEKSTLSSIESIEERSKTLGFIEMEDRLMSLDLDAPTQVAFVN
jgi:uncharacterized membrane protein (DUF106 family)